jgi:hypothetical protein
LFIFKTMNAFKLILVSILMQGSTCYAQDKMDYTWKNRLLILYEHTDNDHEVASALELIKESNTEFKERDLLTFRYKDSVFYDANNNKVSLKNLSTLTTAYDGYILIGKDGGIKSKNPYPLDVKKLFDRIDSMPMRRSEMRSNN